MSIHGGQQDENQINDEVDTLVLEGVTYDDTILLRDGVEENLLRVGHTDITEFADANYTLHSIERVEFENATLVKDVNGIWSEE